MELPVPKRIEKILSHFKLSQKQLAEKAKLSENTISNAKKGKNIPNVHFFNSIYKAFPNLDPQWLYLGKGKMLVDGNMTDDFGEQAIETDPHDDCMRKITSLQKEIAYLKVQIEDKEEIIKLLKTSNLNN